MDLKLLALNFGTSLLFLEPFFVQISNTCLAPIRLFRVVHPKPIKNQRQIYLKCLHRAPAKQRHIYICIYVHVYVYVYVYIVFSKNSRDTVSKTLQNKQYFFRGSKDSLLDLQIHSSWAFVSPTIDWTNRIVIIVFWWSSSIF